MVRIIHPPPTLSEADTIQQHGVPVAWPAQWGQPNCPTSGSNVTPPPHPQGVPVGWPGGPGPGNPPPPQPTHHTKVPGHVSGVASAIWTIRMAHTDTALCCYRQKILPPPPPPTNCQTDITAKCQGVPAHQDDPHSCAVIDKTYSQTVDITPSPPPKKKLSLVWGWHTKVTVFLWGGQHNEETPLIPPPPLFFSMLSTERKKLPPPTSGIYITVCPPPTHPNLCSAQHSKKSPPPPPPPIICPPPTHTLSMQNYGYHCCTPPPPKRHYNKLKITYLCQQTPEFGF